ncbi:aldo/keto reductase [Streptomyces virginiae]|uniref:aldo/keto reductase n=1 Tax=Streptomyces virginiae TaxID=1961 RepID=UPI00345DAAF2
MVAAGAVGRARAGPGRPALRRRRTPVLPARQRPADRQDPPGHSRPGRLPPRRQELLPHRGAPRRGRGALAAIAEKHDRTVLELAIGWLSARPGCASVIAGATSAEQVRANAAAGERPLDADLLAEIDAIAPGVPA